MTCVLYCTSTVLMCVSRGSEEDVVLALSSSFSLSEIQQEKASDSLLKRSHHTQTSSSWTTLEGQDTRLRKLLFHV